MEAFGAFKVEIDFDVFEIIGSNLVAKKCNCRFKLSYLNNTIQALWAEYNPNLINSKKAAKEASGNVVIEHGPNKLLGVTYMLLCG